MIQDRDSRQRDIVPSERLAEIHASVIGVGAIGRQVALQLVAMGVPKLDLVDHDTVEAVNLAPQGFLESDLGTLKVRATAEACVRLNSGVVLTEVPRRFRRSMPLGDAVFCCVDSIRTRRFIWESPPSWGFFVDGRMSAETLRVLTVCTPGARRSYPRTLFPPEEAYAGSCTAKATIYCANIAAGFMVKQFTMWLRGLTVAPDIHLNLLADELYTLEDQT